MTDQATEDTGAAVETMQDVFNSSGIQAQAQEFNQQVQAPAPVTQYTPPVPDATLDPEGFSQYTANQTAMQNQQVSQLREQLGSVTDELTTFRNDRQQESLKADINEAVTTLENHATGIDRNILLGQLHVRADGDPLFAQIWNNRSSNPQALEKALGVIGAELKKTLPTVDPDVAEAQRALNNATQSMSTTPIAEHAELDDLEGPSFLAAMRRME